MAFFIDENVETSIACLYEALTQDLPKRKAFIFVMSAEAEEREIRLPLGVLGALRPAADQDVFAPTWRPLDKHAVALTIPAHTALFFQLNSN